MQECQREHRYQQGDQQLIQCHSGEIKETDNGTARCHDPQDINGEHRFQDMAQQGHDGWAW